MYFLVFSHHKTRDRKIMGSPKTHQSSDYLEQNSLEECAREGASESTHIRHIISKVLVIV